MEFVIFHMASEVFALPLARVREIIRVPDVARIPLGPASLEGLANLRGTLLPVVSLHRLLLGKAAGVTEASRVVVVASPDNALIGFVVDRMERVVAVASAHVEPAAGLSSLVDGELITGVIKNAAGVAMVQVLDLDRLLRDEFTNLARPSLAMDAPALAHQETRRQVREEEDQLVTFLLNSQEYAFPIAQMREIIRIPEPLSPVPHALPHLLGIINLRERLLPLVSLRRLFNMPPDPMDEQSRVGVITLDDRDVAVGVLMDRVREVIRVPRSLLEEPPALFAQDRQGIQAVCRLQQGKRLVSVLAAARLFDGEAMARLMGDHEQETRGMHAGKQGSGGEVVQLVVFRLAEEEFGVPIALVQEIIRVPEDLTQVPKAPPHVAGMVNLRGLLLPVVDLRTRLGLPPLARNDRQRIIVFIHHGERTGFIVDGVSQVLKINNQLIEPAPAFSAAQHALIERVVNLEKSGRMVMILEVEPLLNHREAAPSTQA